MAAFLRRVGVRLSDAPGNSATFRWGWAGGGGGGGAVVVWHDCVRLELAGWGELDRLPRG